MKIDVIIPSYRPDQRLVRLVKGLLASREPADRILIINTEKQLFPFPELEKLDRVEVVHIEKAEFDHGGTRDRAAMLCNGELLLFMTQDAVPTDGNLVGSLAAAFADPGVWAAYARQLPDESCGELERYTRSFNYPSGSRVKSMEDLDELGVKTFFCSNVCAMYRADKYRELGGFEKRTIFNEDMIFAGKLIKAGGKIAYVAEARVIHSHNYGCMEQLHRNFDLAVSQADHMDIFGMAKSESEGIRLVKQTAAWLIRQGKPWLLPGLVCQSGFKYLGYFLGKRYRRLPKWMVRKLTMSPGYWKESSFKQS